MLETARDSGGSTYQTVIPAGQQMRFNITSADLVLGDSSGAALAGNADQQVFQHNATDSSPHQFTYTVIGRKQN